MSVFIITITEQASPESIIHYQRRVEIPDVTAAIKRLDAALNEPMRKPRCDRGMSKKQKQEQNPTLDAAVS